VRLEGKTALVTGASAGIGRATALLFAGEGAHVYAIDVQEPGDYGTDAIEFHRADVALEEDWERLAGVVSEHRGKLDILVNNAAIVGSYDPIDEIDLDKYHRIIAVNQTGTFLGMRMAIPLMRRAGGGSIINLSSIWGIIGADGVAAYQASKGAVRTMTKNAARTYAKDGIRANSLHPGTVNTPMVQAQDEEFNDAIVSQIPLGRMADAREVAYCALFLASDESSFVTGVELPVDGGYLIR
jgi:NAD(P)-dependent dehydrogenase (short-subunit alcohol dehydrogenase family)